jgi:hypothetical protein
MSIELFVLIWLALGALAWVWAIAWLREITVAGLFVVIPCLLLGPFALIIVGFHAGSNKTLWRW